MVRVKCTGEQCEVNRETFRSLRLEEKRVRRSYAKSETFDEDDGHKAGDSVLSLDVMPDGVETPSWLLDPHATALRYALSFSFSGCLMYFPFLILASFGFSTSSGIAHAYPIRTAPGIRSSPHRVSIRRTEMPHFSEVCRMDK